MDQTQYSYVTMEAGTASRNLFSFKLDFMHRLGTSVKEFQNDILHGFHHMTQYLLESFNH
jgi:hypothetical protein